MKRICHHIFFCEDLKNNDIHGDRKNKKAGIKTTENSPYVGRKLYNTMYKPLTVAILAKRQ